jgi:hypothetical protein
MLNPKKLFYQINVRLQKKFKKILHLTRLFVKFAHYKPSASGLTKPRPASAYNLT